MLIVDRATYHNVDVTARIHQVLQANGGHLKIASGTDYNQLFTFDPAPGVAKQLVIFFRWSPQSAPQQAAFKEGDGVDICGFRIIRAQYHNADVTAHTQKAAANGLLHIGTDYNGFFGFDPQPGVQKQLTITYRLPGSTADTTSTFTEGQEFKLGADSSSFQILRAQYHNADVTAHVQKAAASGVLQIGTDYNGFFGFDPQPGLQKKLTITYRLPGSASETTSTFLEGQEFKLGGQAAAPTKSGLYGGDGGAYWENSNGAPISRISIRSGAMIDGIQLYRNGAPTGHHGGGGGVEHNIDLDVSRGEKVVRVDLKSGGLIDSLQFHTNLGRSFGPFGGPGGVAHSVQAPAGQGLVGLAGKAGGMLDGIQFFWA